VPDEQQDRPVTGVPPQAPDETAAHDAAADEVGAPAAGEDDAAVDEARTSATADEGLVVRDDGAVPDEETLARIATPGVARRAPKYGAFIGFGAVLGFVLGVVLAFVLDRGDLVAAGEGGGVLPFLGGSNGAKLMSGVALAGVGALLGALLALWADARSRRR
jgi:hypothetical protein